MSTASRLLFHIVLLSACSEMMFAEEKYFCERHDVVIEFTVNPHLEAAGVGSVYSSLYSTLIKVPVRSRSTRRIKQIAMAVDFMDRDSPVRAFLYAAIRKSVAPPFVVADSQQTLQRSVQPGAVVWVGGTGTDRVLTCPASIRVTSFDIQFEDGRWHHEGPNQNVPPSAMTGSLQYVPKELLGKAFSLYLEVGLDGKPKLVSTDLKGGPEVAWIQSNLVPKLRFKPGRVGNVRRASETTLFVCIEMSSADSVRAVTEYMTKTGQSARVLNVVPIRSRTNEWMISVL